MLESLPAISHQADQVANAYDFLNNPNFNANLGFKFGKGGNQVSGGANMQPGYRPPNRMQSSKSNAMDMFKILELLKSLGTYI